MVSILYSMLDGIKALITFLIKIMEHAYNAILTAAMTSS